MHRKERASIVKNILDNLFPNPSIPLHHTDLFTLLIAVLLSAQCTDEQVNKVTKKLFSVASTVHKMASLSVEEIMQIIQPCGLYKTKATSISALSHILIDEFHGQVPSTLEALESLPGVGHKTASVVLVQGFGIAAFPVDTHIHRCAKRWGLSSGKSVEQTEKDLKRLFPKKEWGRIHLQIIYYARTYCKAKGHHEQTCPICLQLGTCTS